MNDLADLADSWIIPVRGFWVQSNAPPLVSDTGRTECSNWYKKPPEADYLIAELAGRHGLTPDQFDWGWIGG